MAKSTNNPTESPAADSEAMDRETAQKGDQAPPYGGDAGDGGGARGKTPMNHIPTCFVDLAERQRSVVRRLRERVTILDLNNAKRGALTPEQQDELAELKVRLQLARDGKVIDPLFKAVQAELAKSGQKVKDHLDGKFPGSGDRRELSLASVMGILALNNQEETGYDTIAVGNLDGKDGPPRIELRRVSDGLATRFGRNFSMARGEFTANQPLFERVLPVLDSESGGLNEVKAVQLAGVVKILGNQGIVVTDRYLDLKVRNALGALEGGRDDAPPSSIVIDLPDLDEQIDIVIVSDNIRATQALYFSAMIEELKVYQVVDKLVQLFQYGMLPLGKGSAGDMLYSYWKKSTNRLQEMERRNMYARCFGIAGGDANNNNLNREFDDLFLRFVSAVSAFIRQFSVDELLRSKVPLTVSMQQVHKSGRDLAANLSLRGYGIAYFAATELQTQIKEMFAILSEPEIRAAYGARDAFQLIDQVATLELGGAKNGMRYSGIAKSSSVIIAWLAERAALLNTPTRTRILDLDQIRDDAPRPLGTKAMTNPNDRDLVDACETWLALTGTQDDRVEQYSQASEGPMVTGAPIRIPDVARDALESVNIPAQGYGVRPGYTN